SSTIENSRASWLAWDRSISGTSRYCAARAKSPACEYSRNADNDARGESGDVIDAGFAVSAAGFLPSNCCMTCAVTVRGTATQSAIAMAARTAMAGTPGKRYAGRCMTLIRQEAGRRRASYEGACGVSSGVVGRIGHSGERETCTLCAHAAI